MEKEFLIWDIETFNNVLEATKIKEEGLISETQKREAIMKAVDRIKYYFFALDKEEKKAYHKNAIEVIDSDVYNDWLNFWSSYKEYEHFCDEFYDQAKQMNEDDYPY